MTKIDARPLTDMPELLQAALDGSSLGDVEIHLVDLQDVGGEQPFGFTFGIVRLGSVNVSSFETKSFKSEDRHD